MGHLALVMVHAVAAVSALVFGMLGIRARGLLRAHTIALAVMVIALAALIAAGWPQETVLVRVAYVGLAMITAAMVVQGALAERDATAGRERRMVGRVGLNVVILTTGLLAVGASQAGSGVVGIVAVVAATPLVGLYVLRQVRTEAAH